MIKMLDDGLEIALIMLVHNFCNEVKIVNRMNVHEIQPVPFSGPPCLYPGQTKEGLSTGRDH